MREDRAVFEFIAQLLRKQFRLYFAILALAIVGIVAAHGWSWTSAIVVVIAAVVIPLGRVLATFRISVFQNASRPGERR